MQWPAELIAAFRRGLEVEPVGELTYEQVLFCILDETARRAVWRARGDPAQLVAALRTPFTPLGSVVPGASLLWAKSLCLRGPAWGAAVDAFNAFMEENAKVVCDAFMGEMQPYDSDVGFGF